MPTPSKTSHEHLVSVARGLVDQAGPDALTLVAVARIAGIKAPSLYKHFSDRAAILKAVEIGILRELTDCLRRQTQGTSPHTRLVALATAYRAFGKAAPNRYKAIFSGDAFNDPEIRAACLITVEPLFEELQAAGVAADRLLPLARILVAFLHGFVLMETGNAFNLGGDIDETFLSGIETILLEVR